MKGSGMSALWVAVLSITNSASADEIEALTNLEGEVAAVVTRDDKGRVIRMEELDGSSPSSELYYDANGCLDRIVYSNGTVDEFECDKDGTPIPRFFGHKID